MAQRKPSTSTRASGVVLRVQKGKKGDHLYLDIHDGGRRRREFLKLYLTGDRDKDRESKLLAEQIRSRRLQELRARKVGLIIPTFKVEEDFIEYFRAMSERKGKPWKNTLAHLTRFAKSPIRFADLTPEWIHAFRDYLKKQGLATNSIAAYFDTMKTALNVVVRSKIIPQNPFLFADTIPRTRTQRVYLTIDELQQLANTECSQPIVRRVFLFACMTGLRISDLRALKWKDVRKDGLHVTQKKTGDYTYIPLSEQALGLLGGIQTERRNDVVFAIPFSDDMFNRHLLRWARQAGIDKHVSSHIARHTFATMLVSAGNDLYAVQHLLGHRDIKVTQIYAKLVDQRKQDAIRSLPTILKG
jgi:site-specific recombinase XerD